MDGTLTVTDATKFNLLGTGGGIHTVAELKAKYGADTKIGIWVGVTSSNGVEKTATISSVTVQEAVTTDIPENPDIFTKSSETLGEKTTAEEELDITPLEKAIEVAIAAKEDIAISEDGQDVSEGTYWVTKGDMDALDAAITVSEAAMGTVETQQDVINIVEDLEVAVSIFNDAKQEAI